jgi:hypothetical protein
MWWTWRWILLLPAYLYLTPTSGGRAIVLNANVTDEPIAWLDMRAHSAITFI